MNARQFIFNLIGLKANKDATGITGATWRTALGLGTAAQSSTGDFDAAGAASAVQINLNAEASTRAAADTTNASAAAAAQTTANAACVKASNLSDLASKDTSVANLFAGVTAWVTASYSAITSSTTVQQFVNRVGLAYNTLFGAATAGAVWTNNGTTGAWAGSMETISIAAASSGTFATNLTGASIAELIWDVDGPAANSIWLQFFADGAWITSYRLIELYNGTPDFAATRGGIDCYLIASASSSGRFTINLRTAKTLVSGYMTSDNGSGTPPSGVAVAAVGATFTHTAHVTACRIVTSSGGNMTGTFTLRVIK